jgi:hypothetical protein
VKYICRELKHAEYFENDDDNDNDSDDVEDVSVHGSWITRRYPGGKQDSRRCDFRFPPRPALPSVIRNDLCEKIAILAWDKTKNDASAIFVAPYASQQTKISASACRFEIKEKQNAWRREYLDSPGVNFSKLER